MRRAGPYKIGMRIVFVDRATFAQTVRFDTAAAKGRGVAVCNVRGYATRTVPGHVFALLLALRCNLGPYQQAVRDGEWSRSKIFCLHTCPIRDLADSTPRVWSAWPPRAGGGEIGRALRYAPPGIGPSGRVGAAPGGASPSTMCRARRMS